MKPTYKHRKTLHISDPNSLQLIITPRKRETIAERKNRIRKAKIAHFFDRLGYFLCICLADAFMAYLLFFAP